MPVIDRSSYVAPLLLRNGHLQTLYPTLARRIDGVHYERERIFTPDDDFLWSENRAVEFLGQEW